LLAVIWDDRKPVIIVDPTELDAWQARLTRMAIAVAPSCIDARLLALVHAAFPLISPKLPAGAIGGGYSAVVDAIEVDGVGPDIMLAELDVLQPGASSAALDAIAKGTLRLNDDGPGGRH
jgi:hypothetical protein